MRAVYDALQNEVVALGYYFREYKTMFATTPERIEFLNNIAPVFFRMIFDTLWSEILMHLSRMTDPAAMGKFENLSVQQLPAMVDEAAQPRIAALSQAAVDAAQFAEAARNKVLAHRDLHVYLDPESLGITLGSLNDVSAAIGAIEAVLDAVGKHYGDVRSSYHHDMGFGLADDLIEMLQLGVEARRASFPSSDKELSPP